MRLLIDISDQQIKDLTGIGETEKMSLAELIRQAIAAYLEKKRPKTIKAFGVWKDCKVGGVIYQEQSRSEW